jgi:hypothetical protein
MKSPFQKAVEGAVLEALDRTAREGEELAYAQLVQGMVGADPGQVKTAVQSLCDEGQVAIDRSGKMKRKERLN